MKEFWCDFIVSLKVEAENEKQAKEKYWNFIFNNPKLEYPDLCEIREIKKER